MRFCQEGTNASTKSTAVPLPLIGHEYYNVQIHSLGKEKFRCPLEADCHS